MIHTGEKPFHCTVCCEWLRDFSNLTSHIYTRHIKVKRYKCVTCHKKFMYKCHLNVHLRIHMKKHERIYYYCDKCEKKYSSNSNLKRHKKDKHNKLIKQK